MLSSRHDLAIFPSALPQCMVPLQTVDIIRFREQLELESETTQRMSSSRLIAMCKER